MNEKTTKKTTKKRAVRKKAQALLNEPVTISELQSWLSGVVEFQEVNWTPNKEQWVSVMNKIKNLINDSSHEPATVNVARSMENNQPSTQNGGHVPFADNHRRSVLGQGGAAMQPAHVNHQAHGYSEEPAPPDAPLPPGKTVVVSNKPAVKASTMAPRQNAKGEQVSSFNN